jgi:hypothetical protein
MHAAAHDRNGPAPATASPRWPNTGAALSPTWTPILVVATAAGVLLRVWISTLGYNYDLQSFQIVGNLVAHGENVYATTQRYNYGPVWFGVLGAIKWVQLHLGSDDIQAFHLSIAVLLTLVDVGIVWLLARRFGTAAGAVFALCPVSILTTGFHSQFDNLAVLLALVSWELLEQPQGRTWTGVLVSAAIMGVSLSTKHVLIFFPLWVLFWAALRPAARFVYVAAAYAVFLLGFVPFALNPTAFEGIRQTVFGYDSYTKHSLLEPLVDLFVPVSSVNRLFSGIPVFSGVKFVWLAVMLGSGWIVMRRLRHSPLLHYLLALVAFSPAMAAQYLAIPVAAIALYWRSSWTWLYVAVSTTILVQLDDINIGSLEMLRPVHLAAREIGFTYAHAQIWLLVLLVTAWLDPRTSPAEAGRGVRAQA